VLRCQVTYTAYLRIFLQTDPKDLDFLLKIWNSTLQYGNCAVAVPPSFLVSSEEINALGGVEAVVSQ
jgi:hypothetical protein